MPVNDMDVVRAKQINNYQLITVNSNTWTHEIFENLKLETVARLLKIYLDNYFFETWKFVRYFNVRISMHLN